MRQLGNEEIANLLKPLSHGVGKPFYIDSEGNKHFVDKLPPCGGFVTKADGRRVYIAGDSDIVAYKDKD